MTPEQIKQSHDKVTQEEAIYLARLLDQWMARNKQPSKSIEKFAREMEKDNSSGAHIANCAACAIVDWFAYGN